MTLRSLWLIAPFTLLPAGCGTAHNLNPTRNVLVWGLQDDEPKTTRVFGGVREDLAGLREAKVADECSPTPLYLIFIAPFYAVDLPFSLVGDTLTLPYTAAHALLSQRLVSPAASSEEKPPSIQGRGRFVSRPPTAGETVPGNAFSELAGNKFSAWSISPRVDFDLGNNR